MLENSRVSRSKLVILHMPYPISVYGSCFRVRHWQLHIHDYVIRGAITPLWTYLKMPFIPLSCVAIHLPRQCRLCLSFPIPPLWIVAWVPRLCTGRASTSVATAMWTLALKHMHQLQSTAEFAIVTLVITKLTFYEMRGYYDSLPSHFGLIADELIVRESSDQAFPIFH